MVAICSFVCLLLRAIHLWGIAQTQAFVLLSSYAAFSRQYEVGKLYSFDYETSVVLNEPQAKPVPSTKDVGFKVNLGVELSPVWQNPSNGNEQIIEMKVSIPKLSVKARQGPAPEGFVSKSSKAEELKEFPFFFLREGGKVKHVYHTSDEPLSWVNIKKGIASLFQYNPKDGLVQETDTSGLCNVLYKLKGKQLLHKTKTECEPTDQVTFFNHTDKVLSAKVTSQVETTFELDPENASIKSASSYEVHVLRPEARKTSGVEVIGKQVLHLKGKSASKTTSYRGKTATDAVTQIAKQIRSSLVATRLPTTPDPKECIACKSLKDLVNNFRKSLSSSNLGTQSSAIAFLRLLGKMRESDDKTIKTLLKDKKNSKILTQLLDIVAAAQTIPAHTAAMSTLNFNGQIDLPERYLLSLSLCTHPPEFVIEDLLKLFRKGVKDDHLSETLILTIASMTKTFVNQTRNANQKIVSSVRNTILTELEACQHEPCILKYLRALKNLQSEAAMPTLLNYAKGWSRKKSILAIRAIQTMPTHFINDEVLRVMHSILFELDDEHDSSVRAMAAEILLRWRPSKTLLEDVFRRFRQQDVKDRELNTLILGHIRDLCEKNPDMNQLVEEVLRENEFANYHILSHGGMSSAFSRPLMKDAVVNASFSNMLETSGGLLKRSNVDVFVDVGDNRLRLLSFGMFAGGLSMFGGEETDDDEEANAGIEVSLMGTQLRPFVFFKGQGELMGHVWSGTASERTTALQGSVMLQDHNQVIPLQNGLNAELLLTGVVSFDFAGQIQISLWNRNAHSLVEVGAAVVVQGQARVDNAFVQTMVEFNVGAQTQLNFVSDLDFSDEIMMCLQMTQPDFDVVDNVRKLERIPGSNYVLRKYKRKSSVVPGKTYVMNRKNTELCNKMFSN